MNRALDMGCNGIINVEIPDKPHYAVHRMFFYRNIKSLIEDYNLFGIKDINSVLETEKNRRIICRVKGK